MDIYKGEKAGKFTTYIYDEDGETKIDPTTLEDVIIWLYMDYTNELVNVYSISGNQIAREGNTYNTTTLTVNGNDLEFYIDAEYTQELSPGQIIFQLDEVNNGEVQEKYTSVLATLKDAK